MKKCTKCGKQKSSNRFYKKRIGKRIVRVSRCILCEREVKRNTYSPRIRDRIAERTRTRERGVTPKQYKIKLRCQKNRCAICGRPKPKLLDHDHKTNRVRGILCVQCNFGLGHFQDSIRVLKKAIRYLKKWRKHGVLVH
jgi:Recombination endonuclease VII